MNCFNTDTLPTCLKTDSREQFFNKLEIEQDAMVMQFLKKSTNDKSYIARPRSNQYRCNKRQDNIMNNSNSLLIRSSSPRPNRKNLSNSPRKIINSTNKLNNYKKDQLRPISITSNTIYPVKTK